MGTEENAEEKPAPEGDFVDRSKIDFDPDDGLLSGTAIDGTSQIPGPHADDADADGDGDGDGDGDNDNAEPAE